MSEKNIKKLHDDHSKWNENINNWLLEIDELASKLKLNLNSEKTEKYLNHLKHNKRFLNEMIEVIESHELFLNEFEDLGMPGADIEMDHYKTEAHIEDFQKRFDKLKVKIRKL